MSKHPITPPPELVEKLRKDAPRGIRDAGVTRERHLVIAASRWGADQELIALLTWLLVHHYDNLASDLQAARRPKPLGLAEQALEERSSSSLTELRSSPADGEMAELVETLKGVAYWKRHGKPGEPAPASFDIRQADRLNRAAELLERQAPVPVSVSDALIKAECALSDIAEGEPMTDEGDPLKWAERRCADTLAVIRPTMMQHKIRTSEWPPVAATALPLPEVGE